jgi:hypothetical protein
MLIGPEKSLGDEQSRMNQSTRGQWDWYANHRKRVERLIVPAARGQRICVLGAGNCNDLDLKWLVEAYAEVHLVDIDPRALERAAQRQGVSPAAGLRLHAPFDLTGIADLTKGWQGRTVKDAEIDAAVRAAGAEGASVGGGGFDVVVSPCVLSQLLIGVREVVGKDHPGWPRLKAAIRARHLRTVMDHCRPGGRGVLVIDLSSPRAIPRLSEAKDEDVPALMRLAVEEGKCFRGLEPAELRSVLRGDGRAGDVVTSAPWLWHLGWGKAFLVYGMTVARG